MRKPSNMFTVFPFPFIYTPALLLAWDRIHYNANMKIKGKRKITDVSEEGRSLSNIHNFEKCLVKITVWQTWHAQETLPPCISVYHGECGVLWLWSVVATGGCEGAAAKWWSVMMRRRSAPLGTGHHSLFTLAFPIPLSPLPRSCDPLNALPLVPSATFAKRFFKLIFLQSNIISGSEV